ncbi:MAG: ABC transporter ATP-binding protein [Planctomycetota bacterium]|nr:MAG: ABC transporter ATP-binding protein [Planctomycetota bacterium]
MLRLEEVHSGYGPLEVLHGVSLEIRHGEIVTLIGANGAGKTTTLNTVCGLVPATRGTILLDGEDITRLQPYEIVARGVAQSPEGRRLFPDMTVLENLEMGAYLRRDGDVPADIEHMYELFPILADRRAQRAGSLSGGEQQMLAIARALMARPRLLLLDEPSLGLAPLICRQIFDTVAKLNADEGVTVFIVEQNAHAALDLAHRAYVLETGDVLMSGAASALREDPRVRAAYLGE